MYGRGDAESASGKNICRIRQFNYSIKVKINSFIFCRYEGAGIYLPASLRARMEEFMRNTDKKKENMVLMSLRISAEDKEQIEEKARKTGLSTSEYIRRCALGRKLPCYGDTSLLKEYSIQLGKIGSNLNQIAKHLNGGGDFYSIYYGLKEAIRELLDLKFKILPALEDVACGKKRRRKTKQEGEA